MGCLLSGLPTQYCLGADVINPSPRRLFNQQIRPGLLPEEDEAAGAGSKLVNELKSQGMQVHACPTLLSSNPLS